MPEQPLSRGSPLQRQSRKAYDYLIEQPASHQKYTNRHLVADLSPYSKEATEYELIVQFQLRREKEKTLILEERLRNKESFIKQMKEFQDQLTLAFEKCQEELHYYKAQCQDYQSRFNSFATFNNGTSVNNIDVTLAGNQHFPANQENLIREYVEEIEELKHLVIRLEEEINNYQKKEKINSHHKYMSSSVKNDFHPGKQVKEFKFKQSRKANEASPNKKKPEKSQSVLQKKQRSKTLANEFVQQKRSQNFNTYTKISQFIQEQTRKASSFINHFLTMCEFFEQSIEKEPSIKHKLKKAWKWIKSTIVQWNYLKTQKIEKVKQYKIGNIVTKLLPVSNLSIPEIQNYLQKILKVPGRNVAH